MLDIYSFLEKDYNPLSSRAISLKELHGCAAAQGVEFEYGDILLIRTGWSDAYERLKQENGEESTPNGFHSNFAGLDRGDDMVNFLHDNYFSAVASDSPTFEVWPPLEGEELLHCYLLPLWGVPIGEMWDLDALAEHCKKSGRYCFFLTSSPANVKGAKAQQEKRLPLPRANTNLTIGGVGSHPNAIAIF